MAGEALDNNWPLQNFYFSVIFSGFPSMDSSFQEVSGLKVTVDTEEIREGGDNNFVHHIPTTPKYDNLVLKRCLLPNSKLIQWCRDALEDFKFDPKNLTLSLLGENGGTLASWTIVNAFPISWELSALDNAGHQLAIETLTLKYRLFKRNI